MSECKSLPGGGGRSASRFPSGSALRAPDNSATARAAPGVTRARSTGTTVSMSIAAAAAAAARTAAPAAASSWQGRTLVRCLAQRKHFLGELLLSFSDQNGSVSAE